MLISKKRWFLLIAFLLWGGLLLAPAPAAFSQNPLLNLLASAKDPQAGEEVYLQVRLDTAGRSINTIHLEISYDAAALKFVDSSFTGSVVPSVVERNADTPGLIKLTGFRTTPFTGAGLVTTLKFKALKTDSGRVTLLSSSTVHLADGNGTDIYDEPAAPIVNFSTDQFSLFEPDGVSVTETEADNALLGDQAAPPPAVFPEKEVEDYTGTLPGSLDRETEKLTDLFAQDPEAWLPIAAFAALALIGTITAVVLLIRKKRHAQL